MRFVREFELKDKSRKWGPWRCVEENKVRCYARPLSSVSEGGCRSESPQEQRQLIRAASDLDPINPFLPAAALMPDVKV